MNSSLLLSLVSSCLLMFQSQVINLDVGEITLPQSYSNKRIGTTDSLMGEIRRSDGTLVIYYDIGAMAGIHMHPQRRKECVWFREQKVNGRQVFMGLIEKQGTRQLIVSIKSEGRDPFTLPANFWATVRNKRDIADVKAIALSYRPKERV